MAANSFPDDEVLIARGKYSTVASERRALFKKLREDMEAITNHARLAVKFEDDMEFSIEQASSARKRIDAALQRLAEAALLSQHLNDLKPLAWGNAKEIE